MRLNRRAKHALRLKAYYSDYSDGVPYDVARTQLQTLQYARFPYEYDLVGPSIQRLPSSSFLVPSVIEALSDSKEHKDAIEVVPGEADAYCADYLRRNGGLVLSGDSDLLVHDLGVNGAMAYFDDVQADSKEGINDLHAHIFYPTAIAERLNLPQEHGIRALAFELTLRRKNSLELCIERAPQAYSIRHKPAEYEEFIKEYRPIDPTLWERSLPHVDLDPRVSEYVLQYFLKDTDTAEQDAKRIFLPLLIDSPVIINAYEASTPLRQVAYTFMNLTLSEADQCGIVHEYTRQLNTLKGKPIAVLDLQELPRACMDLMHDFDEITRKLPELSPEAFWIATMVLQDVRWSSTMDKEPLSLQIAKKRLSNPDETKKLDWQTLHFLAQFHGSYYSFRLFKQITKFLKAGELATFPKEILELYTRLEDLPKLRDLPDVDFAHSILINLNIAAMVAAARDILGLEGQQSNDEVDETAGRAGETKKVQGKRIQQQTSNNPFDVLAID